MDRRNNPYAPGAGMQPPEPAGRDRLIEDVTIDMDRVLARRPTRGLMLLGLRGVGKTVLLNRLRAFADHKGFETVKIEAPEGGALPDLLAPELRRILYALDLREAGGRHLRRAVNVLRGFAQVFKVRIGDIEFSVEPAPGAGDSGNLEQDLPHLLVAVAEAAAERRSAVGLFVDEIQYLSSVELAAIVVACHEIAQRNLPLLFIGAGLPQVAALSGSAKSYAERLFDYPEVGPLDPDAARAAIAVPARKEGISFDDGAIEAILQATRNYPYFIQEWGFQVWNRAPSSPIAREVVADATPDAIARLDASFFRVGFDRLTVLQQKYLRAMAELGPGPHHTGQVATALGVAATSVATVRQQLVNKGIVWSQRRGEVSFTAPLFDRFMKRQMPTLEKHVPARRTGAKHRPARS